MDQVFSGSLERVNSWNNIFGYGAGGRNRTGTELALQRILSPLRLPVPPLRHFLENYTTIYSTVLLLTATIRATAGIFYFPGVCVKLFKHYFSNVVYATSTFWVFDFTLAFSSYT